MTSTTENTRRTAADPPDIGPGSNGLGARLRAARERSGETVRGLARRIDVSPSLISQIERGLVTPSVATLYSIANELPLRLDELFREGEPSMPPRDARSAPGGLVQRHDRRKAIRLASGVRWERLTALPDESLEFLHVTYPVGAESCAEDALVRHGGKEYAYLLSGRLGVRIGFDEFELGPGDSLSFDADRPHRLWTVGRTPAIAIWVVAGRHADGRSAVPPGSARAKAPPPARAKAPATARAKSLARGRARSG